MVSSRIQKDPIAALCRVTATSIRLGWIWFAKVKLIVSSTGLRTKLSEEFQRENLL